MNDLISIKDGVLVVTSKEIADRFGKVHRDVMRDIERLQCSNDFRVRNFAQSYYTSAQNKKLKCYTMTRDGFCFLCMGFTGKRASQWKESYIEAFNKMESYIKNDADDLHSQISKVSKQIDKIKEAGSAWGKTGAAINRAKKDAISELNELMEYAQMQLEFK